jgi:hypothetical protein
MTRCSPILLVLLSATAAFAENATLLDRAWPETNVSLRDLGKGVGVVFTPDLSVPGNCGFYQALGFACFESADWREVLRQVDAHNARNPDESIETLVLETPGTNGHGLKLQEGKQPKDGRSYIAIGALQEALDPAGVDHVIVSACNSGRLLRPQIYRRLNRRPGDRLFLPATRGILDASRRFDPETNDVVVITPARSHIETTLVGSLTELSPSTLARLCETAAVRGIELPRRFAISEMMIRMLLRDPSLELLTGAHVGELSGEQTPAEMSERLFRAFVHHLDQISAASAAGVPTRTTATQPLSDTATQQSMR